MRSFIACVLGGIALSGMIIMACNTPEVMIRVHTHKKVACVGQETDWKEVPITDPACVEILKSDRYVTVWVSPSWKP